MMSESWGQRHQWALYKHQTHVYYTAPLNVKE